MNSSVVDPAEQALSAFFDAVRPVEQGYQKDAFAFVAVKHPGGFTLVQGRLFRNPNNESTTARFETDMVLAGRFAIAELGLSSEEFVRRALLGSIPTPLGALKFAPESVGRYQRPCRRAHHLSR